MTEKLVEAWIFANVLCCNAMEWHITCSLCVLQDGVLTAVLSKLSSEELQYLTAITELLHTVVKDEWRPLNKMSAHTLGIACGLSLFPQLDPSKATAFTSYLIQNYDRLNDSHTVL